MVSPSDMTDAVRGGSQHDRCEELRQEGNEYFKEKRFESAIDKYSQALAIATALEFGAYSGESGVAKLYANRAAASAALGDWEAVERDADKSIETDPKYVKGYFQLQRALKKLKRYDEALDVATKARELAPDNEDIRVAFNEAKRLTRRSIDDYEITKEIGTGNYTSIFIAVDLKATSSSGGSSSATSARTGSGGAGGGTSASSTSVVTTKEVAIKIADKARLQHMKKTHELRRERDILGRCRGNENIIQMQEFFQDESQVYMVMDHCKGDLWEMTRKTGLTLASGRYYLAQVLSALSYLHSKEIMHRDIKAENVLVDHVSGRVKVIDFGTAKDGRNPNLDKVVETGPMRRSFVNYVGTPQFMSPECIKNEVCSYPSECWSFGCLVFQVIYGLPPYQAGSEYLVILRVMNDDLEFPSETLYPEVNDLVRKCCRKAEKERLTITQIRDHAFFNPTTSTFSSSSSSGPASSGATGASSSTGCFKQTAASAAAVGAFSSPSPHTSRSTSSIAFSPSTKVRNACYESPAFEAEEIENTDEDAMKYLKNLQDPGRVVVSTGGAAAGGDRLGAIAENCDEGMDVDGNTPTTSTNADAKNVASSARPPTEPHETFRFFRPNHKQIPSRPMQSLVWHCLRVIAKEENESMMSELRNNVLPSLQAAEADSQMQDIVGDGGECSVVTGADEGFGAQGDLAQVEVGAFNPVISRGGGASGARGSPSLSSSSSRANLVERLRVFVKIDAWERESRPGQGPNAKLQRFLDEDAKKMDDEEEDDEEDQSGSSASAVSSGHAAGAGAGPGAEPPKEGDTTVAAVQADNKTGVVNLLQQLPAAMDVDHEEHSESEVPRLSHTDEDEEKSSEIEVEVLS